MRKHWRAWERTRAEPVVKVYATYCVLRFFFFFSSRRRHTRLQGDWSSDVCSSDLFVRIMIDANEAWGAKEALTRLETIRRAGYELLWVEDPILRSDFDGLRLLRQAAPWTLINSGEYLDAGGKRLLMEAGATDILNVHGAVT